MATPTLSTGQSTHPDPPPPSSNDFQHSQTASTTSTSTGPVPPNLVRRSSFEPMRLGLGSLPPPVFSRAPPGQRSVPAIEFLNKDSTSMSNIKAGSSVPAFNNTAGSASGGLPSVLASGTNTPGVGLGNGSMTSEPWNLWSDSTAPNAQEAVVQPSLNASKNSREDNELASALAAAVVLDKNHDKRSSINSRVSSSSSRSRVAAATTTDEMVDKAGGSVSAPAPVGAVAASSSWPEGLSADPATALQPQSFALDHNASPEKLASSNDLSIGKQNTTSLIPRNVSFSSMLDLPQPDQVRLPTSDNTSTGTAGLDRKGSLTRRVTSNTQSPLTTVSSTNGSTFPSTQQPSVGIVLGIDEYGIRSRQNTNMSNVTTTAGSDFSNTSIAFGTLNNINENNTSLKGVGGFSIDGYGNTGRNDQQQQQQAGNNTTAFGGTAFAPRRDSGYGHSIYNNTLSPPVAIGNFGPTGSDERRGSRSASWQVNNQYGSPLNPRMSSYSYSPPPPPNPYTSSFSLTPDGGSSFMTPNSSSSGTTISSGNSSSLLRYPSLNGVGGIGNGSLDYLLNMQQQQQQQPPGTPSLSNYGLGIGGFGTSGLPPLHAPPPPTSPFMRYPNSLPSLGPGLGGFIFGNSDYERPRLYEEKNRPIRSPLLEEFRADKLKRWGVRDMQGHIAEFMCDQVGSRYIQESILEHPTSQDCDLIFEELINSNNNTNNGSMILLNLSIDVFANFCVQKLLEKASLEQIFCLIESFRGNILRLSLQTYGCRVIQKAIEVASPDHQIMILRELEGAVQKCVRDQNANHVIQKIVTTCPPDFLQFVVDAFIGNVYTFATHPYSCRVLQRILENCPERMTRPILEELKSYALNLMQDQYGNYVIQFCLERGLPHDKSDIICQIYGQVLHFSKHKFASNVIEKCIMNANDLELNMIAGEVLAPGLDGNTGIQSMLRHEYANYPLQRLIKHTSGPIHAAIVDQVSMQLAIFRESIPPFNAKHLVAVEKLLADIAPAEFPGLMRRRYEDHYISRR